MLSPTQKEIINNLKVSLSKLNLRKTGGNSLINIKGIVEKHNAFKKAQEECELNRSAWKKIRCEEAKVLCEKLNKELNPIGLKAYRPSRVLDQITITVNSDYHVCHSKTITISVENVCKKRDEFGNHIITGFAFQSSKVGDESFDTIEGITKHVRFERWIEALYALT